MNKFTEGIIKNKGNVWAYYADWLFGKAKACMDEGNYSSPLNFSNLDSEKDQVTSKLRIGASKMAEKLALKITENLKTEANKGKDLRCFFKRSEFLGKPKEKPGGGFRRPIDDYFDKFKESLDQEVLSSEEYKQKGKLCFLAHFAFFYNRNIVLDSLKNNGQKLIDFTKRSYDASVVYDIVQFLNSNKDSDYGYLSGICNALDVNGYANATNVKGLKQVFEDIETGIKNNGGNFEFLDITRTLLCVAPLTTSDEFDKCFLEFLKSDTVKDKPISKRDLTDLLIAKSYIINHTQYKNNDFKIDVKSINQKTMEHAKNSVAIKNVKFSEELAQEIIKRLELANVEEKELSLAEYAAIAGDKWFTGDQMNLFQRFKPKISFDVAEVLVLSELGITIPNDKKIDFVNQIIDFMKKKANEDGEYIISFDAAVKILGSLNLEKLGENHGLSEEQKLELLNHISETSNDNDFIRLVEILKPSSEEEQMAILQKIKDDEFGPYKIKPYIETVQDENVNDNIKNELVKKYRCYYDLSCYESLKALDLKDQQIDILLKKIKERKPYYPFSLHVLINALPNASEKQKLDMLSFDKERDINYKAKFAEAIECAKAFKFKEKQSKIAFLNALDKFIDYGYDELDAKNILALAEALELDFSKDNDNDLKSELLKAIARYIKDGLDKETDKQNFMKYQLDPVEAYKISKALNLSDSQKEYLCSSQKDAGDHTIINFSKPPKEIFKASEIRDEFKVYLGKNTGIIKNDLKNNAQGKLDAEIKQIHEDSDKYWDKKIRAEQVERILHVAEDNNHAKELFDKLMRDKETGVVKGFSYISGVIKVLDNNPEIKEIINSNEENKKTFSDAVLKSEVDKSYIPKLTQIIGMDFIKKDKDVHNAFKKLNDNAEIKIPVDIVLSCNDGKPVKKSEKAKIRATIKMAAGDAEPKGQIKFTSSDLDSFETKIENLTQGENGEYYADIEYEIKMDVDGWINAEYIPKQEIDEYYINGYCKSLNITTGSKKIDTEVKFDVLENKNEPKSKEQSGIELGKTINGKIYLSGIINDLGKPKGKLEIHGNSKNIKTIELNDKNIKQDGDKYYVEFSHSVLESDYISAIFLPSSDSNYANGKNESGYVKAIEKELTLRLVLDGDDGKNGHIKTKLGQKHVFKIYLDGYDEKFPFGEKGEGLWYTVNSDGDHKLFSSFIYENDVKKENDKYYIEVESAINPEATGIYAKCEYYGAYYSIEQAKKVNIEQEEIELKITEITSSGGNKIKIGTKTKLRAYLEGVVAEVETPKGNVVFNLPDGTKSMADIKFDFATKKYYAEIEYQPNEIVSWGDAKNITAEYLSFKSDFYKECEYKNEKEKATLILEVVDQQQKENPDQDVKKSKLIITQANYLDQKIKSGDKIRFDIKLLEGQKDLGLPEGLLKIEFDNTKQYVRIQKDNTNNKYYAELVYDSNVVYESSKIITGKVKYIPAYNDVYEGRAGDLNIEMEKSREEEEKENKNKGQSKKKLNIGVMYIDDKVKMGSENSIGIYVDGIKDNKIPKGKLKLTVYDCDNVFKEYDNIDFASLENGRYIFLNEKIKFDKIGQFVTKAEYIPIDNNDEYENGNNNQKLVVVEDPEETKDDKDDSEKTGQNHEEKDVKEKKKINWFSLDCEGHDCKYDSSGQWDIKNGTKAKITVKIKVDEDLPKPNGSLQIMLGKNGENGIFAAKIKEVQEDGVKNYIAETDFEPQVEFTGDYSVVCADINVRYIPENNKDIYDFDVIKPLNDGGYKIFVNKPEKIKDDNKDDKKEEEKGENVKEKKKINSFDLVLDGDSCRISKSDLKNCDWAVDNLKKAKLIFDLKVDSGLPKPDGRLRIKIDAREFETEIKEIEGRYCAEIDYETNESFKPKNGGDDFAGVLHDIEVEYLPAKDDIYVGGEIESNYSEGYRIEIRNPKYNLDKDENDNKESKNGKDIEKIQEDLKNIEKLLDKGAFDNINKENKDELDKIIKDINEKGLDHFNAEKLRNKLVDINSDAGANALDENARKKIINAIYDMTSIEQIIANIKDLIKSGDLNQGEKDALSKALENMYEDKNPLDEGNENLKTLAHVLEKIANGLHDDKTQKRISEIINNLTISIKYMSAKNWIQLGIGVASLVATGFFTVGTFGLGPVALLGLCSQVTAAIASGSGVLGALATLRGIINKSSRRELRSPKTKVGILSNKLNQSKVNNKTGGKELPN